MKRNYWIAYAAILVVIAVGVGVWRYSAAPPPTQAAAPAQAPAPQQQAAGAKAEPERPSFDAVHVGPDGDAVIAGRAAPGAEVTVLNGGTPVGHATADTNGEFVIVTNRPLPPGPQSLSLSAKEKDQAPVTSSSSLALVVPPHGEAQPPVAVLLPPQGPARTLGGGQRPSHAIALDMVEYDAEGRTVLSGRADPGTSVQIAVNGHALASVSGDSTGAWSANLFAGVPPGRYRLAISGRTVGGGDAGQLALDMRRPGPGESGDYLGVVPGNTLWHLAERSYGAGLRYVELYRANSGEIEDPNRIFPGQLLALPQNH